jgi:hypothetical protein
MTLMTLMIRHIGRKECYVEGAKRELGFRTASWWKQTWLLVVRYRCVGKTVSVLNDSRHESAGESV